MSVMQYSQSLSLHVHRLAVVCCSVGVSIIFVSNSHARVHSFRLPLVHASAISAGINIRNTL